MMWHPRANPQLRAAWPPAPASIRRIARRRQDEGRQSGAQWRVASEKSADHDLVVGGGEHSPALAAPAAALLSEGAGGGEGGLLAAGVAAHVGVEQLPCLRIVVALASTVRAVDAIDGLLQLRHMLDGARVGRVPHNRLRRHTLRPGE